MSKILIDKGVVEQVLSELTHGLQFGSTIRAATILRAALELPEPYDQTELDLCDKCGWKAVKPGDGCLNCQRQEPEQEPVADSVTSILLDVVPGPDGMGKEVYATSAADVVRKLSQMAERIEELEGSHTHPVPQPIALTPAQQHAEDVIIERESSLDAAVQKAAQVCPPSQMTVLVYDQSYKPVQEPVAWRWKWKNSGWQLEDRRPVNADTSDCTVEPLYAHPAPQPFDVLLKALESIAEYTGEGSPTTPWQEIVRDISETARAAIAKATGQGGA